MQVADNCVQSDEKVNQTRTKKGDGVFSDADRSVAATCVLLSSTADHSMMKSRHTVAGQVSSLVQMWLSTSDLLRVGKKCGLVSVLSNCGITEAEGSPGKFY